MAITNKTKILLDMSIFFIILYGIYFIVGAIFMSPVISVQINPTTTKLVEASNLYNEPYISTTSELNETSGLNISSADWESQDLSQLLAVGLKDGIATISAIDVTGDATGEVSIELKDEFGNVITTEPLGVATNLSGDKIWVSFSDKKIRMYNSCGELQKTDGVNWFWTVSNIPDGLDYDGVNLRYCSSGTNKLYQISSSGAEADLGVIKRRLSLDGVATDNLSIHYTTQEYEGYNPNSLSGSYLVSSGLGKISKRDLSIGPNFIQTLPSLTPIWTNEQDTPGSCLGITQVSDASVQEGHVVYLSSTDGNIYKIRFIDKVATIKEVQILPSAKWQKNVDGSFFYIIPSERASGITWLWRSTGDHIGHEILRSYAKITPLVSFIEAKVIRRPYYRKVEHVIIDGLDRFRVSSFPMANNTYSICTFDEGWTVQQKYFAPIIQGLWTDSYDGIPDGNWEGAGTNIHVTDMTTTIPQNTFYITGRYADEGQTIPVNETLVGLNHFYFLNAVFSFLTDNGALEILDQFTTSIPVPQGLAMGRLQIVDVDIDSDNNNGVNSPDRSDTEDDIEDNMEETQPGKFVTVNFNDDNENGIPDYSDETVSGEGNLVPLVVEVRPQLDWSNVKLIFSYSGEPTLPNFTPQDIGNDFKDYTDAKKGTMRIWNISSPGEARTSGKYIQPGRIYNAVELGFSGVKTFYIEGINPMDKARVEVTLTYGGQTCKDTVIVSVVEPSLGVNNSNNSLTLRPGIPDVNFDIDDDDEKSDEMVEDQNDGFNFWWSRDKGDNISREGIVDVSPLLINVPQSLYDAGFKFYLQVDDGKLYIYPGVSLSTNRRQYLQDVAMAERQREQTVILLIPGNVQQITIANHGANEFVFKGIGSGTKTLILSLLIEEPNTTNRVVADSVKLTFRRARDYWLFLSTRGTPNIPFTYPTEEHPGSQGTVQINIYPGPGRISGPRDPEKKKHLVMLHGYNVTEKQAEEGFDEVYRRLFWIGFRGNFIGLTWDGDEGNLTQFDNDVQNAFQTSPVLQIFLEDRMQDIWGISPSDIDIMAHSLGNLVVFDALRLHRRLETDKLVRNVISYESATWPEAYEEEGPKIYSLPSDPITYTIDQLKQHSWAFWFRQSGFETRGAINGAIYHSYLPDDPVLAIWMRQNDYIRRGLPLLLKGWHYHRDRLEPTPVVHRAPEGENNFYGAIPTLMLPTQRILYRREYEVEQLNLPVGTQPNPMAEEKNNYLATDGGWRPPDNPRDVDAHSRFLTDWFPIIYKWYDEFLGNGLNRENPGRIPIGEE